MTDRELSAGGGRLMELYCISPEMHEVCSSNLFRGYYGPLPSGKPITPSTKLYPSRSELSGVVASAGAASASDERAKE
ncbi:hypothetical protein FQN60_011195, partial [Etheostoma spectabile]